jgi:hypothetical protein
MVAVIVLKTDGTWEKKELKPDEFGKEVGGYLEIVPLRYGYTPDGGKTRRRLLCFANEEGFLKKLPHNPWSALLYALGIYFDLALGLCGNLLLLSDKEKSVDSYICGVVEQYKKADDDGTSADLFVELAELHASAKPAKPAPPEEKPTRKRKAKKELPIERATKKNKK